MEYKLIRSGRKTLALCVRKGVLEAHAPFGMPVGAIDKFVKEKEKWITDKLKAFADKPKPEILNYGSMVWYLGVQFPICARAGNRAGFDGKEFFMPPDLSADEIRDNVIKVYKTMAKKILPKRVEHYEKIMNVTSKSLMITSAQTRWGTCCAGGRLSFSWRLMASECEVVDYVVVHELAHLSEMNHSPKFWTIVESFLPNYKVLIKRLKSVDNNLKAKGL
ncbi:MAG: M48 family metallopeptidase [Firmicutes bacterium]|nr:M48 family metallopeptidase [Bacillota bacterium]